MSREGWIVAIGVGLLLVIVPYAMWAGLSAEPRAPSTHQRPPAESQESAPPQGSEETDSATDEGLDPPESVEPAHPRERTISGTVSDAEGTAIAGARIALEGEENVSAISNAEGAFELASVTSEALVLVVTAFGYAETLVDVAATKNDEDVVMAPADNVTGTVFDPDGKPVSGAQVRCDDGATATATSDNLGRFTLPASAAGCDALASATAFADSARVELHRGPNNYLALAPLASIRGIVVDPQGAPHTGFVLSLHSFTPADGTASMRPYRQTFSHPQGRFHVTALPAGTYVFTLAMRGRSSAKTTPIVVASGEQLRDVKIVVE